MKTFKEIIEYHLSIKPFGKDRLTLTELEFLLDLYTFQLTYLK